MNMATKGTTSVTTAQFETFGELLRYLRRRAGLTQQELAIAVGYSESQISRLEKNERAPDEAMLAARFVPALYLDKEPEWSRRLLELGKATHEPSPTLGPGIESAGTPNNLPVQLTSFIGRKKELAEIIDLLASQTRFISLIGPGGSGKTRLALRVAGDQLGAFPDGVWLVELAPLSDAALVPETIAAVLGVEPELGKPVSVSLQEHLKKRRVLIVLDNCEHMVHSVASLLEALLRACPDIRVLATSREILGVPGELSFYVSSLSCPEPGSQLDIDRLMDYEAVNLFVERGRLRVQDFALSEENANAVVQICQRLDGIPLALELAAARLRMMQVDQIATRLDNVFRLLTTGTRTALPRHQTLQASFDWSYDLLPIEERLLFQRLAVFAGGWTLEAAEAVCAGGALETAGVLDLVSQLISKSLVQVMPDKGKRSARYRMLEPIRQYAYSKLGGSEELTIVRRKHADYYLQFIENQPNWSRNVPQIRWYDMVETEIDNLQAALSWCLSQPDGAELSFRLANSLSFFWYVRANWDEARNLLRKALSHPQAQLYPEAEVNALHHLGDMIALQSDFAEAAAAFSQGLMLAQELGDLSNTAWMMNRLGWVAREQGEARKARLRLEQSIQMCKELGDRHQAGWSIITLAEVAVSQEDVHSALSLLEEGQEIMQEYKDSFGIGWALNHKGHTAQLEGEYARAIDLHLSSLAYFGEVGSQHGIAWAEHGLGESALGEGNITVARSHLMRALQRFYTLGDRTGISWCLAGLAGVAALDEEPERAGYLWGAAEALRTKLGTRTPPAARATRERLEAEVRRSLGWATFTEAWEKGANAPLSQIIAELFESVPESTIP